MTVLYNDAELTVALKPVGVSSQNEEGKASMTALLSDYYTKENERATPYVLHRLDTGVGGVMVYAKNERAAAILSRDIAEGKLTKGYYAVVAGDASASLGKEGELFDLLFKDSKKNKSFVVERKRRGVKEAALRYRVLAKCEYEGNVLSLVEIELITGRTHQIRVQFSSRGLPLVGDGKYGSRVKGDIALFSKALAFRHPKTRQPMRFELPLPDRAIFDLFKELI